MLKAIRRGTLFGNIDCYIVDDNGTHRRMIGVGGVRQALQAHGKGNLDRYLSRLPSEYSYLLAPPAVEVSVAKEGGGGTVAKCYDAEYVSDVIAAYAEAFANGSLHPSQREMGAAAVKTSLAYQKLGIISHIDEATGYQFQRDKNELEETIKRIINYQPSTWSELWEADDVRPICELYGWSYTGGGKIPKQMTSLMDMIYRKGFGDVVINEIQRINPEPHHGSNHHQYFTPESRVAAKAIIRQSSDLARQSASPHEWRGRLDLHFKRETITRPAPAPKGSDKQESFWDRFIGFFGAAAQ